MKRRLRVIFMPGRKARATAALPPIILCQVEILMNNHPRIHFTT
jgi:hypothetical protein